MLFCLLLSPNLFFQQNKKVLNVSSSLSCLTLLLIPLKQLDVRIQNTLLSKDLLFIRLFVQLHIFPSAKENHMDVISGVVGLRLLLDTLRTVLCVRFSCNRQNILTTYCQRSRKLQTNFLSNSRGGLVV